MAESSHTWQTADVGTVSRNLAPVSAAATSDHTCLGGRRESRLKNPLREICTVGSVRGRTPASHGGLKRARSWKRWIQPKKAYSSPGLLYSEKPIRYRKAYPHARHHSGNLAHAQCQAFATCVKPNRAHRAHGRAGRNGVPLLLLVPVNAGGCASNLLGAQTEASSTTPGHQGAKIGVPSVRADRYAAFLNCSRHESSIHFKLRMRFATIGECP